MAEDAVWTKDEVVTEATRLRDLFRKMFTDRGSFNAVSYLYASRHPETGVYGKGLILVPSHKTATHAVLFVEFPDMNEHYWEIPVEQRIYRDDQIFNATHANEILDFVDDHRDVESILCQCEGGLSRSVAVKAALDTLLNEDMTPYDGTNALVYNTLLETAAARAKR